MYALVIELKIGKLIFIFASHLKTQKDNADPNGEFVYDDLKKNFANVLKFLAINLNESSQLSNLFFLDIHVRLGSQCDLSNI